ncbi:MAG: transcription-repair coupling factor [bacterium]
MNAADKIFDLFQNAPPVKRINELLLKKQSVGVKGAYGTQKALLLINFYKKLSSQIAFICCNAHEAEMVKEEVGALLGSTAVSYFTTGVNQRFGFEYSSYLAKSECLYALEQLAEGKPHIVLIQSKSLLQELPSRSSYVQQKITINEKDQIDFQDLVKKLNDFGYLREYRVEQAGEMSVRGGIVDVFPYSADHPIRIEFWGDQVESLRKFDPLSQRSLDKVKHINLYPQEFSSVDSKSKALSQKKVKTNVLDFLKPDALLVLDEPDLIRREFVDVASTEIELDEIDSRATNTEDDRWKTIESRISHFQQVKLFSIGAGDYKVVDLKSRPLDNFNGNLKLLDTYLKKINQESSASGNNLPIIYFLCENLNHANRMEEIFEEEGIMTPNLKVASLGLHNGFVFNAANLVVITYHQFYGRLKRLRLPRKSHKGLSRRQLKFLNLDDYVVHVDFGIGRFKGLKKIKIRGHERECLHLEYRDGDNLYVNLDKMDRVHKYSSKEGMQVKLNKLGTADWQRLKNRTKKKIKDIAQELIEIYARRKSQGGLAFSQDTLWQKELEASFPFEDTPDQIKACIDVKKDMESSKPMDRLVCGDVGFGKTEVAVRAAFKAVTNGKQVGMLVPTTILAYQHFNTFKNRLEKYPIVIEMLSRFRTKSEQKKILENIKNGKVDILIGTHRILSKDVFFKELGLLIIDEEQRFGVRQKERLKQLKATVDVLTLTATPIPRTLYLSLMGARDISNINTPPRNRLPIVTEIMPFNKAYIREVILNELERGGQVFFVHNRIQTIDRIASMLSGLIPEADIVVAHGQMHEKELEQVMIEFMDRKYHILVSTMIIENGLDMPNVNTIIVNRADKLGLAQLYQLRGRVGRSHHRAFAYLLIPPIETLTDEAMKRLRAIEEFSEIGSGSQLAMRDLEIRGAGNLLGAEQSGFIDALGFDLYNKILDEAVKELKSESAGESYESRELKTRVEIDSDAFIPDDYIESSADRVDVYRRLTESTGLEEIEKMASELNDRFGRPPVAVTNLLNFVKLRILGSKLGIQQIQIDQNQMVAKFSPKLSEQSGEPFKNWLGSMVVNACYPFEFVQSDGLAIRVVYAEFNKDPLLLSCEFLQSFNTAPVKEDQIPYNDAENQLIVQNRRLIN